MNNIIALNVLTSGHIIGDGTPILFYWDGTSEIIEQIKENPNFKKWLDDKQLFGDIFKYTNTIIQYISFKDNNVFVDGDEEVSKGSVTLQNLYSISDDMANIFAKPALNHLYKLSYNEDFDFSDDDFIITIYDKIKEKYGVKLSKLTFINGIRNYFQSNIERLLPENTDCIIKYIENKLIYKD